MKPVLWGVGIALALLFLFAGWAASPIGCELRASIGSSGTATSCLEFWLNRYQTLIAGIFALIGAGAAAYVVSAQTRVAQMQLRTMSGDVDPDFILFAPRSMISDQHQSQSDFCLRIANQNRRPIVLETIGVIDPKDVNIILQDAPGLRRKSVSPDQLTWFVSLMIEGTRPAAALVASADIFGIFAKNRDDHDGDPVPKVTLEIGYMICDGSKRRETKQVQISDANIGMISWSSKGAVSAQSLPRKPD